MSNADEEVEVHAPPPAKTRPAPVKKGASVYVLYAEDEESILHPLGEFSGNSPEDAIDKWSEQNPDEPLDGVVFVPIAKRNFSRVEAEISRTVRLKKVGE